VPENTSEVLLYIATQHGAAPSRHKIYSVLFVSTGRLERVLFSGHDGDRKMDGLALLLIILAIVIVLVLVVYCFGGNYADQFNTRLDD
jgi:hypothetical protein